MKKIRNAITSSLDTNVALLVVLDYKKLGVYCFGWNQASLSYDVVMGNLLHERGDVGYKLYIRISKATKIPPFCEEAPSQTGKCDGTTEGKQGRPLRLSI
uniref:Uncharacterized protein n=1 Tax=Schistocephalus solidus TaxID=70667 RepID=A0A0X3P9J4_SCHSO